MEQNPKSCACTLSAMSLYGTINDIRGEEHLSYEELESSRGKLLEELRKTQRACGIDFSGLENLISKSYAAPEVMGRMRENSSAEDFFTIENKFKRINHHIYEKLMSELQTCAGEISIAQENRAASASLAAFRREKNRSGWWKWDKEIA